MGLIFVPVVMVGVLFCFASAGALLFVVLLLIPPLRRFSLSSALFCLACGPPSIGLALVGLLGMFVASQYPWFAHHRLLFQWLGGSTGLLLTVAVAFAVSLSHQLFIHRLTFALFRLYATAVCTGIALVLGLDLGALVIHQKVAYGWVVSSAGTLWLAGSAVVFGWQGAELLRGAKPERLCPVSPEEYDRTPTLIQPSA